MSLVKTLRICRVEGILATRWLCVIGVICCLAASGICPASAQTAAPGISTLRQSDMAPARIADASVPAPNLLPTDVTPFTRRRDPGALFGQVTRFKALQVLPARIFFNSTVEVSQRLDTNVLFTHGHPQADYAFRAMPNVTLGYNFWRNSSIYCNYFVIKDTFARYASPLNFPTFQSVSMGLRQTFRLGERTSAVVDLQARELWQTSHLHQADLIPSINLTRAVTPRSIIFGGLLLQMRSQNYFQGPSREIDPFYTVGLVHRRGLWNFVASDTLVTNFRNRIAIPDKGNATMVADLEVSRPLIRQLPCMTAFVRAEPVWNWAGHKLPGLSGFDFRLYGGLRLSANKQSYTGSMERLRQMIKEVENPGSRTSSLEDSRTSKLPQHGDESISMVIHQPPVSTPELALSGIL